MPEEQARFKPALLCVTTIPRRPHYPVRAGRVCLEARDAAALASGFGAKAVLHADLGSGRIAPLAIGVVRRSAKPPGLVKLVRTETEECAS
jgi:hypothetical protein